MNFAPRMLVAADASLAVAIERDFDFAGAEYRALHGRSCAGPFQAPGWLDTLHRDLAPASAATPVTVTVRNPSDGRLMLVLPLMLQREHGVRTLAFADFGLCDYLGPVYEEAELPLLVADAELPRRLAAILPRHDSLALIKLMGEQTLLAHLFANMHRARMRISAYPAPLSTDWNAWRAEKVTAGVRRELDMKRRRLHRSGEAKFALLRDPQEITEAFDALRRYRSARFKTIGASDVMDREEVFAFYRRIAIDGARDGSARTECLSLSGEPIAVQFGLVHDRVYSMLMVGLDAVRHGRLSPGLLVIEDSIRAAIEAGDRLYDFTIGDHPYKLQFGATMVPLEEWHRARTLRGYTALAALMLAREAKRHLKPLLKREAAARTKDSA